MHANSNGAALLPSEALYLYLSFFPPPSTLNPEVLPYAPQSEGSFSPAPPPSAWPTLPRVVVTTCVGASALSVQSQRARATFDFILIDEAAQATAPEALVALALAGPATVCLLAGDPCQLPAVVRSPAARAMGLAASLLETAIGPGGRDAHVRLSRSYRSNGRILELPSRLFYGGMLAECAPRSWSTELPASCPWAALFGDRPVSFLGVRGEQMRSPDSPSWANPAEAEAVVRLVRRLLDRGGSPGDPEEGKVVPLDFGIVATYRRQVRLIRELLRRVGLAEIDVGTVDDYQGKEKRIVVISTVLTRVGRRGGGDSDKDPEEGTASTRQGGAPTLLQSKQRFNGELLPRQLGAFLSVRSRAALANTPTRAPFHPGPPLDPAPAVAITRAMAALVVVGSPALLIDSPVWSEFLTHCAARGSFRGAGAEYLPAPVVGAGAGADLVVDEDQGPAASMTGHGATGDGDGGEDARVRNAVARLARRSLLGSGTAGDTDQWGSSAEFDAAGTYLEEMDLGSRLLL